MMPCPDCDGMPERITELQEQFETLRNFAEACFEIIERSHRPVEEITERLSDMDWVIPSQIALEEE